MNKLTVVCCLMSVLTALQGLLASELAVESGSKPGPAGSATEFDATYPDAAWATAPAERFGFSPSGLAKAERYFNKIGGDACVVVHSGFVIAAWGEIDKPIPNYSIRKSYLGSLLGIEFGRGRLDLDATLAELQLDDKTGLTAGEKTAQVRHLLTSSSGVYHEAAHESKEQKGARPPRGSFAPGEFFYYNNWDFNALGQLYAQLSGADLFAGIREKIAQPLGMQDFDLANTEYKRDASSRFPAYTFKSSARDDARFGYLYLRGGQWRGQQVVPADWVRLSSASQVKTGEHYYYDYGFLWWVDTNRGHYFARGNSGQYIAVLPDQDMVVVFRADPGSIVNKWTGRRVKPQESFQLIPKILQARSRGKH